MFCLVLSSRLYASLLSLCVCILLWRYLLAAYLCWVGWWKCRSNGVCKGGLSKDGYLYFIFSCVHRVFVLFDSISAVKFRLGCVELKYVKMDCILVWVEWSMRRMPST